MARKKHIEYIPSAPVEIERLNEETDSGPAAEISAEAAAVESLEQAASPPTSILDEVQSFLQKRDELLRKLADEIEATESRLAELRRTAQLLQAEAVPESSKDKKNKKPKPKSAPKAEKRSASVSADGGEMESAADAPIDPEAFETPAE